MLLYHRFVPFDIEVRIYVVVVVADVADVDDDDVADNNDGTSNRLVLRIRLVVMVDWKKDRKLLRQEVVGLIESYYYQ